MRGELDTDRIRRIGCHVVIEHAQKKLREATRLRRLPKDVARRAKRQLDE